MYNREAAEHLIKIHLNRDFLSLYKSPPLRIKNYTGKVMPGLKVIQYLGSVPKVQKRIGDNRTNTHYWLTQCNTCSKLNITNCSTLHRKNQDKSYCDSCKSITHNMSRTKLYVLYKNTRLKCYTTTAKLYNYFGLLGYTMCDRWLDFNNFVADTQNTFVAGYQLKIVNDNKVFGPDNCMWYDKKNKIFIPLS